MKITEITAYREKLVFEFENADRSEIQIGVQIPLVCGPRDDSFVEGRIVCTHTAKVENGACEIPRFVDGYDTLVCRFVCGCEGVCYVTETKMEPTGPSHTPKSLKGVTSCKISDKDAEYLGIGQVLPECNMVEVMTLDPTEDVICHVYNGKNYYFRRAVLESVETEMIRLKKLGISGVMRYISSSYIADEKADPGLLSALEHPSYDRDFPSGYVNAFNLRTEEGFDYYCACTDFILSRYAATQDYGIYTGFEMGNEVSSQYIWQNAGEMECSEFIHEYTEVMRIAWLLARKYSDSFRIYASFDQLFAGRYEPNPRRFYGLKECTTHIQANCDRDGDFPWNVTFHPYPENLSYPDFWNDRAPNWSFETGRVTFKNVEVMTAWMGQEQFLYKGEPRHLLMPEQGFNSRPEDPYTLKQGMYGYYLAYKKISRMPNVDGFYHHSYMDNLWEFGLNLGLVYNDGQDHPAGHKPICQVFRDMGTPNEDRWHDEARSYIGEEIFDKLMDPPAVIIERDHSKDGFQMGKGRTEKDQQQNFDS